MAAIYRVEYLQDSGTAYAHLMEPMFLLSSLPDSSACPVILFNVDIPSTKHPRVRHLTGERLSTRFCLREHCQRTTGHHAQCWLGGAKRSATGETVGEGAQTVPVVKEIVTVCGRGWSPIAGSKKEERPGPNFDPLVVTMRSTIEYQPTKGFISHAFRLQTIPGMDPVGFEYAPIVWKEYDPLSTPFGPQRIMVLESLDGGDALCIIVRNGIDIRNVTIECTPELFALEKQFGGDVVDEIVQRVWWTAVMSSISSMLELLKAR